MSVDYEALAKELYALFSARAEAAGLKPDDFEVTYILASMVAAHYEALGRTQRAYALILDTIERYCQEGKYKVLRRDWGEN
jgi:hypothetical protein